MPTQEKTASRTRAAYILTLILVVLALGAQTGGAMALARDLLPEGGAIVAPMITKVAARS
jgi:hypothetical protein